MWGRVKGEEGEGGLEIFNGGWIGKGTEGMIWIEEGKRGVSYEDFEAGVGRIGGGGLWMCFPVRSLYTWYIGRIRVHFLGNIIVCCCSSAARKYPLMLSTMGVRSDCSLARVMQAVP